MIPLLRNALMGPGHTSFDSGRMLWVGSMLSFLVGGLTLQVMAIIHGQPFSMTDFGIGFGGGAATLLAAGGIGISLKDRGVAKASATMGGSDAA